MTFFELLPGIISFSALYFILTTSLLVYWLIQRRYKALCIYGFVLILAGVLCIISSIIALRQFAEAADSSKTARPLAKLIVNIASHFTSRTGAGRDEFLRFWVASFLYSTLFYGVFLLPYGFMTSAYGLVVNIRRKRDSQSVSRET